MVLQQDNDFVNLMFVLLIVKIMQLLMSSGL